MQSTSCEYYYEDKVQGALEGSTKESITLTTAQNKILSHLLIVGGGVGGRVPQRPEESNMFLGAGVYLTRVLGLKSDLLEEQEVLLTASISPTQGATSLVGISLKLFNFQDPME